MQDQGGEGNHHQRLGLVQADAVAVQHAVAGKGGQGQAGGAHEVAGQFTHRRLQRHVLKNKRCRQGGGARAQAHAQGLPQRLAHHVRHLVEGPGADVVGHDRAHRHHHANQGDDGHVPDGDAQRNTGQVLGRGVTRHRHIQHRHADGRQLSDQDRPGQLPQGACFGADACAHGDG